MQQHKPSVNVCSIEKERESGPKSHRKLQDLVSVSVQWTVNVQATATTNHKAKNMRK